MAEMDKVARGQDKNEQPDTQLKGAFASVMIVGAFILGCWLLVFILFMIRNGG
jgi:hypothetical protein